MTYPDGDLRDQLAHLGAAAVSAGLVVGSGGNLSAREPGADTCWVTGAGTWLDRLGRDDFALVRIADGAVVGGHPAPSSEWRLHTATYRVRATSTPSCTCTRRRSVLLTALGHDIALVTTDHAFYLRESRSSRSPRPAVRSSPTPLPPPSPTGPTPSSSPTMGARCWPTPSSWRTSGRSTSRRPPASPATRCCSPTAVRRRPVPRSGQVAASERRRQRRRPPLLAIVEAWTPPSPVEGAAAAATAGAPGRARGRCCGGGCGPRSPSSCWSCRRSPRCSCSPAPGWLAVTAAAHRRRSAWLRAARPAAALPHPPLGDHRRGRLHALGLAGAGMADRADLAGADRRHRARPAAAAAEAGQRDRDHGVGPGPGQDQRPGRADARPSWPASLTETTQATPGDAT